MRESLSIYHFVHATVKIVVALKREMCIMGTRNG